MDRFKAAVDLYTCSIRALEQRSMAFLIVQSLLVAGYVTLLARCNAERGVIAVIIAMGIIFCFAFFIAGKTTSIDASAWRSCIKQMDNTTSDPVTESKLWSCYKAAYSKQSDCVTRGAPDRLPGPTLWIFQPAVFLAVWISAILRLFMWCPWLYIIPFAATLVAACLYYKYGIRERT